MSAAERKKAQRERDRTQGVKRVEIRLSQETLELVDEARKVRGSVVGDGDPYDLADYVSELIRLDTNKLKIHLEQLNAVPCGNCGKSLPGGCGNAFKGEGSCLKTREAKQLLLSEIDFSYLK